MTDSTRDDERDLIDDPLVSRPNARKALGDPSAMTIWRWEKKGILPEPIMICGRAYYRRSQLNAVLDRVNNKITAA